ncbi:MAG: replication factor C small subunit [Nitrososphaerales archaeon]|nr:replication factor C small subunit [Nitrososphaerales archaeon]
MSTVQNLMWVEKYRPLKLEDMVNQKPVVERLLSMLKSPNEMPHLLFTGPPGVGKTTAALCVARAIMNDYWRDYTLELNASDERGINTVRERIKTFARYADRRVDIPFRIIILDEVDAMTSDAQTALRRIMETSSNICRFILIANYSSAIIEPIQSRCAILRFSQLEEKDVVEYLEKICKLENLKYKREALSLIYEVSEGDLRHAINILQAAATIGEVDVENVKRTTGISAKAKVNEIVNLALKGRIEESRNELIKLIRVYGMLERDFLKYAHDAILRMKLPNSHEAARVMAEYDYRLIMGAHPEIQLSALLAELGRIGKEAGFGKEGN